MASTDTAVLKSLGRDLLENFVAVTVETFLYAIYAVLVVKAASILLGKSRQTRVSLITLTAVIVLFLLRTALWVIDVRNVIVEIKLALLSSSNDSIEAKYNRAGDAVLHLASSESVLYAYMTNIGDSIIIWRVHAFWSNGRERLVLILPCAMLLGSIISTIMLTYCTARLGGDIVLGSFQHPAFCKNIQTASYSTTVATTAVATILIGYKTWRYRRTIRSSLDETKSVRKTRAEKIMIILIESGILYTLFFLEPVILNIGNLQAEVSASTNLHFASTVYQYMTSTIVGMYPTIIVIIVNSRLSFIETTAESVLPTSQVIEFKHTQASDADASGTYWGSSRIGVESRCNVVDVDLQELRSVPSGSKLKDEGSEGSALNELEKETKAENSTTLG